MFDSIFFNGDEYNQMWLNGSMIWEKDSGGEEIVYPYDDADCVITYYNVNTGTSSIQCTFTVIDETLPYSINGVQTTTYDFPKEKETQVKLINLKPAKVNSLVFPIKIEQLRLPNLTDLSYLFSYFCCNANYEYSWSPQYFEFSDSVTDMSHMFYGCECLTQELIDQFIPSYFPNTSKVTTMKNMFYKNYSSYGSVTSLDISSFDTSNVTNMSYMFYNQYNLTSIKGIDKFNTQNVTDMSSMFSNCHNLTSLDISSFDTSNVTNMSSMFSSCHNLTSLNVSNFDLSHNPTKSNLFSSIGSSGDGLILNVSNWKLPTSLSSLFTSSSIVEINGLDTWDTSNVTSMSSMFSGASGIVELDLSSFDFTNITSISSMFYNCKSLKELNLSSFDTSAVASYGSAFSSVKDCTIYVNENKWTLGTSSTLGSGTNLKFVIVDDNGEVVPRPTGLLADFTKSGIVQLPVWMDEEAQGSSYYFTHGTYKYDSTLYGLINNSSSSDSTYWTCYKIVAPSNTMKITFRAYTYGSGYPFTIHVTSDATQPTYSSATNRILNATVTTYRDTDGIVETEVVAGETYYIHFQYNHYFYNFNSSSVNNRGVCIRSIEFLPPIESIDLSYDVDLDNVEQQVFTVSPIIEPSNYDINDLEIIYDSNYMAINPTTFEIKLSGGSQGMSHTVTYRSKTDNSISKSFTFYVSENLTSLPYLVNLQQFPTWFTEANKKSTYYYTYGTYNYDSTLYGLVENSNTSSTNTYWTCYKIVAPITGSLEITFRANIYRSSYPFTIHSTSSATQPNYESPIDRIISVTDTSYRDTDGVASIDVVQGETYYIHIQHRRYRSSSYSSYSSCIRSIELIPSEE